ncbi:TolB-like protein/Tfp pilus assembly protein PilF [Novosphingobium hassiacum]|uniref:TolB-like protein/Tfp pilus assembly protein PilF n=1 Tax=Novosphingobium hassiacum TaxID=173676 RepID=A0A7W6EVL0_9SPHN|nr:TIR domain-containing protein [Novosphingobium hassiacum]MBB3860045.1 TolB-like protein/Tfp pilus assembly protein PilF [Novosphingobium hassiacum]
MVDPPRSVFLSYASADRKAAVAVVALLEQAGFSVWWDGLLEGGERFSKTIADALEAASAVVVLWSATSTSSYWVHDEAEHGRNSGRLVPLSIDGSLPPLGFRQFQAIDIGKSLGKPDSEPAQKFLRAVAALHQREPQAIPPRTPARRPALVTRRAAIVAGSVAVVAVGSGIALRNRGGSPKPSIAVLPFANLTGEAEQRYFSDGLTSEIRTRLIRNPMLQIVGQASSETVDRQSGDIRKIASELGVAFVLSGNVQRAAGRVKIAAQMAEGSTGLSKWAQSYERPLADIFALQNEIAGTVAQALSVALGPRETDAAGAVGGTTDVSAFDAYLRGRDLYEAGIDEASDRAALAYFDRAIALDPSYAGAHAARSRALMVIGNLYDDEAGRTLGYASAVAAAKKATTLAPAFAEGFSALGFAYSSGLLDMRAAVAPYQRSYELAPGDADILARHGTFLGRLRRTDQAASVIARSATLDPLNARTFRSSGDVRFVAGDNAGAIEQYRLAISLNPTLSGIHSLMGFAQLMLGDLDAAAQSFEREKSPPRRLPGLAIIAHKRGNRAAAQTALDDLVRQMGDKSLYQYAQIHAQWGEPDRALDELDKAWRLRDGGFLMMYSDPLLIPLRETPRFRSLAAAAGFA